MSNNPRQAQPAETGQLFVVSAPSGTGKTTVVERLVQLVPDLALSRSYTSRPAREGESNGVDYNFVTRARFEEMVAAEEFLEWADVFGNLYGTCASDTERDLASGQDLVLVIDVQGARQVRQRYRRHGRHLRHAAVVRGPRAAAARPQQGRRRGDAAAPPHGAQRGRGVLGIRLRHRQRRARRLRRSAAGDRPGGTRQAAEQFRPTPSASSKVSPKEHSRSPGLQACRNERASHVKVNDRAVTGNAFEFVNDCRRARAPAAARLHATDRGQPASRRASRRKK